MTTSIIGGGAAGIITGDAVEVMGSLQAQSIGAVIADLPYGTTQNKWDSRIDLPAFWASCWRLLPRCGPVICTAAQPFTSALVMSQIKTFRYDLVWEKTAATGHLNAKRAPLRAHESVLVFCRTGAPYHPQKTDGHAPVHSYTKRNGDGTNYGKTKVVSGGGSTLRYPRSVQVFASDKQQVAISPTQKPVALMRWLLLTYTKPDQLILDPTCGSGSTGVACVQTGRRFIGIESDPVMAENARRRIADEIAKGVQESIAQAVAS